MLTIFLGEEKKKERKRRTTSLGGEYARGWHTRERERGEGEIEQKYGREREREKKSGIPAIKNFRNAASHLRVFESRECSYLQHFSRILTAAFTER